jgi:hypothetical protein
MVICVTREHQTGKGSHSWNVGYASHDSRYRIWTKRILMLVNRDHCAAFPESPAPTAFLACYPSSSASPLGIAATIAGLAIITIKTIAIKTSCMEQAPKLKMQQCLQCSRYYARGRRWLAFNK